MRMRLTLIGLLLLTSLAAQANSGRILYVSGTVSVERAGKLYRAVKNAKVLEGDRIDTRQSGRIHIRMSDRSLLSLKPQTEFLIEEYRYEPQAQESRTSTATTDTNERGRSIFRLVKGGFRAVTGLIGRRDRAAFGVRTPVATIGIRGTSFVADLEPAVGEQLASSGQTLSDAWPGGILLAQDGGAATPVLTVGVGAGAVVLTTQAGSLVLENGEFGQVRSNRELPRRLVRPKVDTSLNQGEGDGEEIDPEAQDEDADTVNQLADRSVDTEQQTTVNSTESETSAEPEQTVIVQTEFPEFFGARRSVAFTTQRIADEAGSALAVTSAEEASSVNSESGAVDGFIAGVNQDGELTPSVIELADGRVENLGRAPALGLTWGRWAGDEGRLRFADDSEEAFDLDAAQLHLIHSAAQSGAVGIPRTGSEDFVLIGNTDPTSGTVRGVLGSASLSADFDRQTVASSVNLRVSERVWNANGTGALGANAGPGTPSNVFAGTYDDVRVNGNAGGTGDFAGFLTRGARGAGLSYRLENNGDVVNGVAAFAAD